MANTKPTLERETIAGTSVLAIEEALSMLTRRHLELEQSTIEVLRDDKTLTVAFVERDAEGDSVGVRFGHATEGGAREVLLPLASRVNAHLVQRVSGDTYVMVRSALNLFRGRSSPDISLYTVTVTHRGDEVAVIFGSEGRAVGTRGRVKDRPGFEVVFDGQNHDVLQANFVR